jgi:uncharacterized protein YqhQ
VRESWPNKPWTKHAPWKWPVLRGMVTMVEMMANGIKALNRSASISLGEEEQFSRKEFVFVIAISVVAVVGLFISLPLWIGESLGALWRTGAVGRNILEGMARGLVFVSYVAVIGLWKDVREVFRYHGAEHKTINAFESGKFASELDLTAEAVAPYSRIHPRCGTSFLLVVVLVSIVVFSLIGRGGILWRVGSRVLLLPVVIGISYEIIRAAAKSARVGRFLMSPMLLLQLLTTKEPSPPQIEVAIDSLRTALDGETASSWPEDA